MHQVDVFERLAGRLQDLDRDVIEHIKQVKYLTHQNEATRHRQEVLDATLNQILDQQEAISRLLDTADAHVTSRQRATVDLSDAPNMATATAIHHRATSLITGLTDMSSQIDRITEDINNLHMNFYVEPLVALLKIINVHGSVLDEIESVVGDLQSKLDNS
eukprot:GHVL01022419.1.p1 GENE.GHVL01022419.1~~GHVL01022419.1.p1  ORF type:complete len:161 (+),score=27.56 GHVL01022419.1:598-1080(+)